MRIVEFTKIFNAKDPKTDSNLFEHISTRSELEGLVIWSLQGLKRALKRSAISNAESLADMGKSYEDAVDYVFHWLEENTAYDSAGNFMTLEEIYAPFDAWCKKQNKPLIPAPLFGKKLFAYAKGIGYQKSRSYKDGVQQRGYKFIKLVN